MMMFNLEKDIVFFDVESTGLNVVRDRIVQIGLIKYFKSGKPPEELEMLINPGIPISEEAIRVHGITAKDLANKPVFSQVAEKLYQFIGDSDLAGYNSNRFDIPILMEEFARVGYDFQVDNRKMVDVQRIFYKMEPRTLKAAYQFYCNKELDMAHDALADIRATVSVLKGQIDKYQGVDMVDEDGNLTPAPVQNDMAILHAFTNDLKTPDVTQKLKYNDAGEIIFNFGKHIGKPVAKTLYEDRQYYYWILEKEFSIQVKQLVKKLLKDYEREMKNA